MVRHLKTTLTREKFNRFQTLTEGMWPTHERDEEKKVEKVLQAKRECLGNGKYFSSRIEKWKFGDNLKAIAVFWIERI